MFDGQGPGGSNLIPTNLEPLNLER